MRASVERRAGRYELLEPLGGTALAAVYRANDEANGQQVVVKLLREYFAREPELVASFLGDMERVRRLHHPGVLVPSDVGSDGSGVWLVFPYVPWQTLHRRLEVREGPLASREAVAVLEGVAEALEYVHSLGVAHQDLKPTNVFVGDEGQVCIEGFGMHLLARGVHPSMRSTLTTPHPSYMPPEQAVPGAPPDPSYDIYALASMAYEVLTGSVPFLGLGVAALVRKQTGRMALPSLVNLALPASVDRVLARALSPRPSERYLSAREMVRDLREALGPLADAPPPAEPALVGAPGAPSSTGVETPAQAPLVCAFCGHDNPAGAALCQQCWATLRSSRGVTAEEARQKQRRWAKDALRARATRVAVAALVVVGLGAYTYDRAVGFGPPPPAPLSEVSSISAPGQWAVFGADLAATGAVGEGEPLLGQVVWTFRSAAPILASPAVVDGRVYLPSGDRRVVALESGDGRLVWEVPTTGPMDSSPAVAGGSVYLGLRDGRVLSLEADTGEIQWEYMTGNPVMAPPQVHDGAVYIGSGDAWLYSLDALTGGLIWRYHTTGWISGGPTISGNLVAVSNYRGWAYVVERDTGERRLSYMAGTANISPPVFVGDEVLIGTGTGRLLAIDSRQQEYYLERGFRFWRAHFYIWGLESKPPVQKGFSWTAKVTERGSLLTAPAVLDGVAYMGSSSGDVVALDLAARAPIWTYQTGSAVVARPIVVGPVVYVGDEAGVLHALDRDTGERLWSFATGGKISAQPVYAEGMLFVSSEGGVMYAIR